jgi:thioredoxin-dependent peroxiredoxin
MIRAASVRGAARITPMIEPGELAPDFTLPGQDGNPVELKSLRGRPVVVYFYPKADTPG